MPAIVHSLVPETSIFSCGLLISLTVTWLAPLALADARSAAPKIASEVPLVVTVAVSAASCSPCSAEADSQSTFSFAVFPETVHWLVPDTSILSPRLSTLVTVTLLAPVASINSSPTAAHCT